MLPAAAIKLTVRTGLNGMPAFRPSEIGDRELEAVARYIESSKVEQ
jgi:mono/diheme cytochrome c family protein